MKTCRWFHHMTRWAPCLVESDGEYTLITIEDVQWRMCYRCGHQEEREIECV